MLRELGWKVYVLWECEIRKPDNPSAKMLELLENICGSRLD
jgi:G:T-mismatch repair DNA endonuclease (very short patch repair protein)